MKNITKSIVALFAVMAFSCSSDDVEDRPVIVAGDAPELSAPETGNNYVLSIDNAAMQAERFVWTSASFGQDVAINYEVQIGLAGDNFETSRSLGSVIGANQLSVSVETLNGAAIAVGGTPFEVGNFEVRVKASVNDTFEPLYSNVSAISVTPYVAVIPKLYFVGAPQGYYGTSAWTPENGIEMRHIGTVTTKIYEAYVKVAPGDGFKFIGGLNWDNGNYGTIGGAQDGNLKNAGDSGDIKVAENDGPGLYYVWVDIDNLKYKFIKMNWGIIGSATVGQWNDETPMVYDFVANKFNLTATLASGEMKFRAKNASQFIFSDDWKFNVGVSDPTVVYSTSATNFPITGGSFNLGLTVNFDGTAVVTGL